VNAGYRDVALEGPRVTATQPCAKSGPAGLGRRGRRPSGGPAESYRPRPRRARRFC